MIDARALHGWLSAKWQFSAWVKHCIEKDGFDEETDYYRSSVKTGGRPRTDYLLTLDMAKELAIVERTQIGRMTRAYFIEMEKAPVQMAAGQAGLRS